MGRGRIRDREGHEVHAAIASNGCIEFAGKRRFRGLEQDFKIAPVEHHGDVAGAGRLRWATRRVRIDLDRNRRRRKSRPCESADCGVTVDNKMSDMVKKEFIAQRQPAIDLGFEHHVMLVIRCPVAR